jgi:hypothetical protein
MEDLAFLGERQSPRRPMQQANSEACFQLTQVAGYRGLRYAERVSCSNEAPVVDHRKKSLHLSESIHCSDIRNK